MVKYARGLYVFLLATRVSPLDDGSSRNNSGGRHSTNRVSNANESGVVALQGGHYQIRYNEAHLVKMERIMDA